MAITVLPNVILPNSVIDAGVRGKQMRQNKRVAQIGGAQQINIMWEQTLREFEIGFIPMRRAAWQAIEALHEVTEGGAYGFLMKDPKDSTVTTGGTLEQNAGAPTAYQLYRTYTEPVSGRTKARKITRPFTNISVYLSGVLAGSGYTLDETTGILQIPSTPAEGSLSWTGSFYTPVHFMEDSIDWEMVVPGPDPDARYIAGPSVILREVLE